MRKALLLLAFLVGIGTAGAQVLTSCSVIDQPGAYVLANNVSTSLEPPCFNIISGDVGLDCAGHSIIFYYRGINFTNAPNVSIANCRLQATEYPWEHGVPTAILGERSDFCSVRGNEIVLHSLQSAGVSLQTVNNCTIENNRVSDAKTGIAILASYRFERANFNFVKSNMLERNLLGIVISDNPESGGARHNRIEHNTILGNREQYSTYGLVDDDNTASNSYVNHSFINLTYGVSHSSNMFTIRNSTFNNNEKDIEQNGFNRFLNAPEGFAPNTGPAWMNWKFAIGWDVLVKLFYSDGSPASGELTVRDQSGEIVFETNVGEEGAWIPLFNHTNSSTQGMSYHNPYVFSFSLQGEEHEFNAVVNGYGTLEFTLPAFPAQPTPPGNASPTAPLPPTTTPSPIPSQPPGTPTDNPLGNSNETPIPSSSIIPENVQQTIQQDNDEVAVDWSYMGSAVSDEDKTEVLKRLKQLGEDPQESEAALRVYEEYMREKRELEARDAWGSFVRNVRKAAYGVSSKYAALAFALVVVIVTAAIYFSSRQGQTKIINEPPRSRDA
ncbi:right-handed parallel beta-helix repeat-containing protein [Candidatus Micrarchaeota archaeon]|nr:right-handed parallel beta-helix repeat-containing protein [Candidatus Micrarchaeota archaeon]